MILLRFQYVCMIFMLTFIMMSLTADIIMG